MSTIQLVNKGDLDLYLTGNPSITFFKSVYRKHTNFSMEDMVIGTIPKPKTSGKYSVKIPTATGDLLYKTNLILKGNLIYCGNGIANISTAVIDNILFSIGSREIDRTYGHYLEVYHELNQENPNNTITNIARIEDSSLYHIGHNADLAVLAAMKSNASYSYIDNGLAKPTNIMGAGLGYPPTHFQRSSKCGGTYCSPSYLQKQDALQVTNASLTSNYNFVASVNTKPVSASSVYYNASSGDEEKGGFGNGSQVTNLFNASQIEQSVLKGDILGECILPLTFWYCRSPGLAIPLVALHKGVDVELYIQFASSSDADWTVDDPENMTDNFISYDNTVSCYNDVCNAYQTGPTFCKAICDKDKKKFNFDMHVSVIYIFLDNMEKQRFQSSSHEYLIEQLQIYTHNSYNDRTVNISSFHHPVKELIWTGQPYTLGSISSASGADYDGSGEINEGLNNGKNAHPSGIRFVAGITDNTDPDKNILYGGGITNCSYSRGFGNASLSDAIFSKSLGSHLTVAKSIVPWPTTGKFVQGLVGPSTPDCLNYCSYKIVLNGTDRCQYKPLQYFTRENVRKYHKGGCVSVPDSIAVFSFALNPTDIHPSGTCNFSNIDSIQLYRNQTDNLKRLNVYAINYNILRFVGGQAGLAYVL